MGAASHPTLTVTATATSIIYANRFVSHAEAQAALDDNTLGVAQTATDTGGVVAVDVLGTTVVEAGGLIAKGAPIKVGSDGRAVVRADDATEPLVARARQSAAGPGALIEVLLIPN